MLEWKAKQAHFTAINYLESPGERWNLFILDSEIRTKRLISINALIVTGVDWISG